MELDPKHKNIGATVSMIQMLANKEAQILAKKPKGFVQTIKDILLPPKEGVGRTLAKELTDPMIKLFMAESDSCDHKTGDKCAIYADRADVFMCTMANCPLGALVDDELKSAAGLEDKS